MLWVGNTMFKEGNGKRHVRRGRQGFEGTTLNAAYRSGFREGTGGCDADGSCGGFEGVVRVLERTSVTATIVASLMTPSQEVE